MQKNEPITRRGFVAAATTASLGAVLGEAPASADTPLPVPTPGLIVREKQPENLEFPFASLSSPLTPNDRFYVRSHFAVPTIDPATWRLRVEGAVKKPLELSLDDVIKMTPRTVPATLECAGNSRVFLVPTTKGAQWELGGVSTAEWTGVPLAAVLERAGVLPGTIEVVLEGADSGEIKDPPKPAGVIHYGRSLPLTRAMRPEVLLAYRMNGTELPAAHGFPLRAVVPGWYGMASVKWLTRLVVVETPFNGYYQSVDYALWQTVQGMKTRVPLTEMQVKAAIARPGTHEVVTAGTTYPVTGAAWTGDSDIVKVEVSTDNGKTWEPATLDAPVPRHTWRFFRFAWHVPAGSGRYTLRARATDARGNTQPLERQPDRENYAINHALPIDVEAR